VEPQGSGHYQSQQDACEFLLWLLDTLHEVYLSQSQARDVSKIENLKEKKHNIIAYLKGVDCNDVNSYKSDLMELSRLDYNLMIIQKPSTVYKQFCGQLLEARACETCNRMSVNLEYYVILTLPVPAAQSNLNDCFAQFSEIEHLSHTGGNMISCSCNIDYTQAKRLALLSSLPSLLIIQLARFSYDPVKSKAHKNQTSVVFPVTGLDLSKYTIEGKLESETSSKRVYDLSGFCVHTGASSTNFGHYVSYTKVKDGSWYCFNDDYVSLVTDVQNEICSNFVSQNAYILFYIGR
jgi:ubiquitin C-terminal hydrolase